MNQTAHNTTSTALLTIQNGQEPGSANMCSDPVEQSENKF